jgi:hypothetical protein
MTVGAEIRKHTGKGVINTIALLRLASIKDLPVRGRKPNQAA